MDMFVPAHDKYGHADQDDEGERQDAPHTRPGGGRNARMTVGRNGHGTWLHEGPGRAAAVAARPGLFYIGAGAPAEPFSPPFERL